MKTMVEPWALSEWTNADNTHSFVINSESGRRITKLIGFPGSAAAVNARLISAAPDLLAGLKRAVEYFEANGGAEAYTWLPDLKAALRKAE